ncbi:hypothetical protein AB0H77_14620 [Streptomyces sp. NPDC050844]|uniref:hypothetical protein n=1 Tax=Streptomyces sp. NPDC050844 TaxID=3155790 RepID=UPI0034000A27
MAFPESPLGARGEVQIGGVWTDITSDLYLREPITYSCGLPEQGVRADPGSVRLQINNRDGKYSTRNPLSPYFGLLGRNTPLRVHLPGPTRLVVPPASTGRARAADAPRPGHHRRHRRTDRGHGHVGGAVRQRRLRAVRQVRHQHPAALVGAAG